jgi:predicted ABC-type ATPase
MLYLVLGSPTVSMGRVAKRVAAGGHDVPEDRIRPRWNRSLNNLFRLAPLLDGLLVYRSASDGGLNLLAEKYMGIILWYGHGFSILRLRLRARKPTKPGPHSEACLR